MPRHCINCPDVFCYICGLFITKTQRMTISEFVKKTYLVYFGCKLGDQDKTWAPHVVCKHCTETWDNGVKDKRSPYRLEYPWFGENKLIISTIVIFASPKKIKGNIQYPNLPSAIRPVPHYHEIPIPIPSDRFANCNTSDTASSFDKLDEKASFPDLKKPKLISQSGLDDLVRDLN